jgi:hypothetical protein
MVVCCESEHITTSMTKVETENKQQGKMIVVVRR